MGFLNLGGVGTAGVIGLLFCTDFVFGVAMHGLPDIGRALLARSLGAPTAELLSPGSPTIGAESSVPESVMLCSVFIKESFMFLLACSEAYIVDEKFPKLMITDFSCISSAQERALQAVDCICSSRFGCLPFQC